MKSPEPAETTPLLTAARAITLALDAGVPLMHEMFKTYLAAGFNERQALILVAEMLGRSGQDRQ